MSYQLQAKISGRFKKSYWNPHHRTSLRKIRAAAKRWAGEGFRPYRVIKLPSRVVVYQPRFVLGKGNSKP